MNSRVEEVTERIVKRSETTRRRYLEAMAAAASVDADSQGVGVREPGAWVCGLRGGG